MNELQRQVLYDGGVDAKDVLHRLSGSEEMMNLCLQSFPQDQTMQKLQAAFAAADTKEAFAAAHALKGMSANMGMFAILRHLNPIVEVLRTGEGTITDLQLAALYAAYQTTVAAIGRYFELETQNG